MDLSDNTILKLFVPAVFFFTGVGLVMQGIRNRRQGSASVHWPWVKGHILSSRIEVESEDWLPVVRYEYVVGGTRYEGSVIEIDLLPMSYVDAEDMVALLPAGTKVDVRYDPAAPATSLLRLAERPGQIAIAAGFVSAVVGIAAAYYFWLR